MSRRLREQGLTLAFAGLLLLALVGQALTGVAQYNSQAADASLPSMSVARYVTSSQFAVDVAENWQSEYLQFLLFILLTVWLAQKGSPESKALARQGRESDKDQKVGRYAGEDSPAWARRTGWRRALFSRSLGLTMGAIFFASWLAQFIAGRSAYNEDQLQDLQAPVGWGDYLGAPDFWNRTFQNWQSEFLAVASMVVLSIYLRERGSPESKPVGQPHVSTGVEG
jgi:hypothetical protein